MESMLAVITARGGSKRIPGKNIRPFLGKPMLTYAIDACRSSGLFTTVMVSTDSDEIADVAKRSGAEVPFMRSARTSSDTAITADVLHEVLSLYMETGKHFERFACVYPCVPLLSGKCMRAAFEAWFASGADALMPVCRYPVPIEWAMGIKNGILEPDSPEKQLLRSQDITPKYYDAGMFYFYKTDSFLKSSKGQLGSVKGYIIPESEVQDIDTEEDWKMAELKYRILHRKNSIT